MCRQMYSTQARTQTCSVPVTRMTRTWISQVPSEKHGGQTWVKCLLQKCRGRFLWKHWWRQNPMCTIFPVKVWREERNLQSCNSAIKCKQTDRWQQLTRWEGKRRRRRKTSAGWMKGDTSICSPKNKYGPWGFRAIGESVIGERTGETKHH